MYPTVRILKNRISLAAFLAVLILPGLAFAALPEVIDLATDKPGLIVHGAEASDQLGSQGEIAVADVNGDGFMDLVAGTQWADGPGNARADAGEVVIYFGSEGFAGEMDVAGTHGAAPDVIIYGGTAGDKLGGRRRLATGDVNGDGRADIVVVAQDADGSGRLDSGMAYLILGKAVMPAEIDLRFGEEDTTITGASASDKLGYEGALKIGDVTGDGKDDIILGTPYGDGPATSRSNAGEVYIIPGADPMPASVDLAGSANNTKIYGDTPTDYLTYGGSIAIADMDHDEINDIILGTANAAGAGDAKNYCGEAYIIKGRATFPASLDIRSGDQMVTIYGADAYDNLTQNGAIVTGDFNGDGLADLALGASMADGPTLTPRDSCGEAYILFGRLSWPATIDLGGTWTGVKIVGADEDDYLAFYGAMLTGDLNNDGMDDLVLGAWGGDGPDGSRSNAGEVSIILGSDSLPATIDLRFNGQDAVIYGASLGERISYYPAMAIADTDIDGYPDLFIGTGDGDGPDGRMNCGRVYVIRGAASLTATLDMADETADTVVYGSANFDSMTYQLGLITGDINNDGIPDMIFTAKGKDGPTGDYRSSAGAVITILGESYLDNCFIRNLLGR